MSSLNWNKCGRKWLWLNLRHYSSTCVERLRKTMKTLRIVKSPSWELRIPIWPQYCNVWTWPLRICPCQIWQMGYVSSFDNNQICTEWVATLWHAWSCHDLLAFDDLSVKYILISVNVCLYLQWNLKQEAYISNPMHSGLLTHQNLKYFSINHKRWAWTYVTEFVTMV